MRLPVKLNDHSWPRFLRRLVGRNLCRDPRILIPDFAPAERDPLTVSEAISLFKFGTTFKATWSGRHLLSDQLLVPYCRPDSIILDVGASDGITAVELISKLGANFRHYFATDKNVRTHVRTEERTAFFYSEEGACVLIADDRFVYYPQESQRLRRRFARRLEVPREEFDELQEVELINPLFSRRGGTRSAGSSSRFQCVFSLARGAAHRDQDRQCAQRRVFLATADHGHLVESTRDFGGRGTAAQSWKTEASSRVLCIESPSMASKSALDSSEASTFTDS